MLGRTNPLADFLSNEKQMNNWEFLLIFWAVLIGAGVHNLLNGVGALLLNRKAMGIYAPHLGWVTIHLFLYITTWYFLFNDQGKEYSFELFVFMFGVYSILYLISTLSFPHGSTDPQTTCREHYYRARVPYFALWALLFSVPLVRMFTEENFRAGGAHICAHFAIAVLGAVTPNPRVHAVLPFACITIIVLQMTGAFN